MATTLSVCRLPTITTIEETTVAVVSISREIRARHIGRINRTDTRREAKEHGTEGSE
jgi:hypothetical protein